jgi:hypothetical protein
VNDTYNYETHNDDGDYYKEEGFYQGNTKPATVDIPSPLVDNKSYIGESVTDVVNGNVTAAQWKRPVFTDRVVLSKDHGTPQHWTAIMKEVRRLEKDPNVSQIFANRAISNAGVPLNGRKNNRPDIMYFTKDGKVHLQEFMSPSDSYDSLKERNNYNKDTLGGRFGSAAVVPVDYSGASASSTASTTKVTPAASLKKIKDE